MTSSDHTVFLSGQGIDVHSLQSLDHDHFIMLCGVAIPCRFKLIAHSDGDVGLHALVDAMLGAAALGDIGDHFSPSDMRWHKADSAIFVEHVLKLYQQKQILLINVDVTIVAEQPKISPYKVEMKNKLAQLLNLDPNRVNIKATTTEKLGFLGRSEGVMGLATVSVKTQI